MKKFILQYVNSDLIRYYIKFDFGTIFSTESREEAGILNKMQADEALAVDVSDYWRQIIHEV